jgi:hypothetical protein
MFRPLVVVGLVAILAFLVLPWPAATAPNADAKPEDSLAAKLNKPFDFNGVDDPKYYSVSFACQLRSCP